VQELVSAGSRYEDSVESPSLEDFLARVSLSSDQDQVDEQAGVVLLMTLHAAKGLEFPVVFLVGLEQGLLPHERALRGDGDIEEERRLCFVGMTRAKERLVITQADERLVRGRSQPRAASCFLRDMDDGRLSRQDFRPGRFAGPAAAEGDAADRGYIPVVDDLPPEEAAKLVKPRRLGRAVAPEFPEDQDPDAPVARRRRVESPGRAIQPAYADWVAGTLVQHDRHGVGQVIWIRPGPGMTRAGIRFAGRGEVTLVLEHAPVRRLERGTR
jgi:DNA helicase-2/ATP-dependent DNA helicase PcrA